MEVVSRENRDGYQDQIEQMHRLRHRVFVDRLGWKALQKADGRELDEFDNSDAIYLLVTDGARVVGCHRIIPTVKPHLISEVFSDFCDVRGVQRGPGIVECGRTCIDEERLTRAEARIARHVLMTGVMEFCLRAGATGFTGINPISVMSRYLRIGWNIRPLGIPRRMDDGETYVAVSYAVSPAALAAARHAYGIDGDIVVYRGGDTPLKQLLAAEEVRRGDHVSKEQVEQFERDGVIAIRNSLSGQAIEELRDALDELGRDVGKTATGYDLTVLRTAIFDGGNAAAAAGGATQHDVTSLTSVIRASGKRALTEPLHEQCAGHFVLDTTTWMRNAAVRRIALDSPLPNIAAALLRASKVNFCDDQIFLKSPHTIDRTAVHQDCTYFHLDGEQGCVMWICVDDADAKSGAPFYLRGSHRWGREFAPNVFMAQTRLPGSAGDDLDDIEERLSAFDTITFETHPGDVIVHHFRTVHGAGGNLSDHPRRALSLRYAGEDMRFRRRPGAPEQPHHRHSLRDGDRLDSRQFPVVWPRPFPEFRISSLYSGSAQ
ncbi:MAG TPA: acyl-homoserine-lactone synthase [Rhizomicrobium sp.]|jgi:N-acyl-L-homoserine lactone synthetase/ectoine hydroxylase-related dioxygenase (phytanoyl-CoA dioxygenase family)